MVGNLGEGRLRFCVVGVFFFPVGGWVECRGKEEERKRRGKG